METIYSILTLFVIVTQVVSSPVPYSKQSKSDKEKVLYDQRQEGEWNIRADLKNFVILIIPKTSEQQEPSPSSSLFDLFRRSHLKHHGKHAKHAQKASVETNEVGAETMHFIESKSAPYHVDITKSKSHLMHDEILSTQTPPVAIAVKTTDEKTKNEPADSADAALLRQLRSTRFSKAFVLTVPDEEFVLTKMEDEKKVVKKDGLKKKFNKNAKEEMTLLGAVEQCGPDMIRDSEGVCRLKKAEDVSENIESIDRDE